MVLFTLLLNISGVCHYVFAKLRSIIIAQVGRIMMTRFDWTKQTILRNGRYARDFQQQPAGKSRPSFCWSLDLPS